MHIFDYTSAPAELLTPEVVGLLTRVHEQRGAQNVLLEQYGGRLIALREEAERQSDRASDIEQANYRRALEWIREHFDTLNPSPQLAKDLHRMLYGQTGGALRTEDTIVRGNDRWGKGRARFVPPAADEIPAQLEELFRTVEQAMDAGQHDPLLLIAMFLVDFLSIHPFPDGNAKAAWLLQALLLYRAGYYICAYVSLERIMEQSEEQYQEALQYSSIFWQEGTNQYEPFVRYFLGMLEQAYRRFRGQTAFLLGEKQSKAGRIRAMLLERKKPVRKRDILEEYPDISTVTVERTLAALVKEGSVRKIGGGPATAYVVVTDDSVRESS